MPGSLRRRRLLRLTGACSLPAAVAPAAAARNTWPSRPIRIVVPCPPGSLSDMLARLIAGRLEKQFGQPVEVENRPGSGMRGSTRYTGGAAPDGYTLMMAGSFTPQAALSEDLVAGAMLGAATLFLVSHPAVPATSVPMLMAALRARQGLYTYASPGEGTINHLLMVLLCHADKAQARHVPYESSKAALADVISGRRDLMWIDLATAAPHLRRLRPLAVAGKKRSPLFPDMTALAETHADIDFVPWQWIAAPAGTPGAITRRLAEEINRALGEPAFRQRLSDMGVEANPMDITEANTLIARDADRWTNAIRQASSLMIQ